jgi:hypothetical protein
MRLLLPVLLLLAAPAWAQEAAEWNPRPAADDLALPLPCGLGLALRPVPVPVPDGVLADRRVLLGDEQSGVAWSEFVREAFIAGNSGSGQGTRLFLGKYEVTRAQYVAVTRGCEALAALPAAERRLPQGGLGFAAALGFAEAATAAILRLRPDALPASGEARAYLRLPTEAEWEYAARGASIVNDAQFRQRLPPYPGPLTAHAVLRRGGQRPAPVAIGSLAPDLLGLHDMLGNVEEMVLDPYRPTRGGRAGGRVGGIVARGGHAGTRPEDLRTSLRTEHAPFLADGTPVALPTLGFRVALGLPVLTDLGAGEALSRAWEREAAREEEGLDPRTDARVLAQRLEALATSPAEQRALAALRSAVEDERSRRAEAERRAIRSAIGAGAVAVRELRNATRTLRSLTASLREAEIRAMQAPAAARAELEDQRRMVQGFQALQDSSFAVLFSLVQQQAELPSAQVEQQLGIWRGENAGPAFENLRRFAGLFVAEIGRARARQLGDQAAMVERLMQ